MGAAETRYTGYIRLGVGMAPVPTPPLEPQAPPVEPKALVAWRQRWRQWADEEALPLLLDCATAAVRLLAIGVFLAVHFCLDQALAHTLSKYPKALEGVKAIFVVAFSAIYLGQLYHMVVVFLPFLKGKK